MHMNIHETILKRNLNNGLTYYIRNIDYFKKFITMALTVKIGSMYENKSGLAHLLEHMHMNFHKFSIYSNVRYRTEAYTNFFETTFYIKCFNDWESINSCLEILCNIAKGSFLNELYFIKTKNDVLLEISNYEKYSNNKNKLFSLLLANSQYINCMAIGKSEYVSSLLYNDVLQFYNIFYSADLMSIAVVGDIDNTNKVENKIKDIFGGIASKKIPDTFFNNEIPKYNNIKTHEIEVNNVKESNLEVYFKVKKSDINVKSLDMEIIETILFEAIEIKLKDFLKKFNINISTIICERITLDSFHMFYVIRINFEDPRSIIIKNIVNLINVFLKYVTYFIDDFLISNIRKKLNVDMEKSKYNYYDFFGMHYLLLECIEDFVINKPVYVYSEKYNLLKKGIEALPVDNIYAYLDYWINRCDRLFIAKVYKKKCCPKF